MLSSPMLDAIRKKIAIEGLQNFSVLNMFDCSEELSMKCILMNTFDHQYLKLEGTGFCCLKKQEV